VLADVAQGWLNELRKGRNLMGLGAAGASVMELVRTVGDVGIAIKATDGGLRMSIREQLQ